MRGLFPDGALECVLGFIEVGHGDDAALAGAGEFFAGEEVFEDDADLAGLALLGELGHFFGGFDGFVIDLDLVIG